MGRGHADDPRNSLVSRFIELAAEIRPAFFVMENVPGLLAKRHSKVLEAAQEKVPSDYRVVGPVVLNAADYGAATRRDRVVLIAYDPNRMENLTIDDFRRAATGEITTVQQAISDLPDALLTPETEGGFGWGRVNEGGDSDKYLKRMRSLPAAGFLPSYARKRFKRGFVTGLEATLHRPETIERFRLVEQGKQDPISRYQRLSWDRAAPTLRAGTGSDKGSYQAARPIHPDEPRVITVREAARIQGFPDWFLFHPTKWHSHRMIGNSVSPIFAEAILKVIASKLEAKKPAPAKTGGIDRPIRAQPSFAPTVSAE